MIPMAGFTHFTHFTSLAHLQVLAFYQAYRRFALADCTDFTNFTSLSHLQVLAFYHPPADVTPMPTIPILPVYQYHHFSAPEVLPNPYWFYRFTYFTILAHLLVLPLPRPYER